MIQITIVQLDNYGPWTVTPQPKREADLQVLQSSVYTDLQRLFSMEKAVVFPMRQDNLLAVTNGLGREDHQGIQDRINAEYPVTVSMAVACGRTPYEAQKTATKMLAKEGSAQEEGRQSILAVDATTCDPVQMAHMDINDVTVHTDDDVYRSYEIVMSVYNELMRLLEKKGALVFFMGGDNFISPSNNLKKEDYKTIIKEIKERLGVTLKVGVGVDKTAEDAIHLASMGLKEIRGGAKEDVVLKTGVK